VERLRDQLSAEVSWYSYPVATSLAYHFRQLYLDPFHVELLLRPLIRLLVLKTACLGLDQFVLVELRVVLELLAGPLFVGVAVLAAAVAAAAVDDDPPLSCWLISSNSNSNRVGVNMFLSHLREANKMK